MPNQMTVAEFLDAAAGRLKEAGNDDPRREARLLLSHTEGTSIETLIAYPERLLSDPDRAQAAIGRRAAGEPVSRILGRRSFWKDDFQINSDTLDPRPDTETVIEAVLEACPDRAAIRRVLDLGVGSGCLLLSLLREYPLARGVGVDISDGAVEMTQTNAIELGMADRVETVVGNWFDGVSGRFDLIVSNPPYIRTDDVQKLAVEVRDHDPMRALDGGEDGLACYRLIVAAAKRYLETGGVLALEVGSGQADDVSSFCMSEGFSDIRVRRDLGGIERCVLAR